MPSAPLGATYYPACVVALKIRFDESLSVSRETFSDVTVNEKVNERVGPAAPRGVLEPLILSGSQKNGVSLTRVPKSANVELPAIRKAGTFKLTFDFRDLPIDPRAVRSVGVEIYMGTVTADAFAEGVNQFKPQGQRASQLPLSSRSSLLNQSVDNLVLKGLADNWHVSHTSSGSTVTMEGRDLTGLFLNTPITHELVAKCNLNQPIDKVIQWIVDRLPWGGDLQVVPAAPDQWPDAVIPKLADLDELRLTSPRVRHSADGKKPKVSAGANQDKLNFWDLITRYCSLVGAIPSMTLAPPRTYKPESDGAFMSTIYIQPAVVALNVQKLFEGGKLKAGDLRIPFNNNNPRNVDDKEFVIRRMVFGRNIEDMQVERKFTGKIPQVIEVVAYNPSSKGRGPARVQTVRSNNMKSYFPELHTGLAGAARSALLAGKPIAKDAKASGRSGVSPRGDIGKQDVLRIPIYGVSDTKKLQIIANNLYEEICKGEMGGSVKTRSLASFGAGNEDPDLIHLRPGDGINLAVDARPLENRAPAVHPLMEQHRMSSFEMMQDLVNRTGMDPVLARVVVATLRNEVLELQNTYRVNTVKYDWSVDKGISLSFDFHNYVEVRDNVNEKGW